LQVRRLVCFGKETWIKIKETLKESFLERRKERSKRRKKKIASNNKRIETSPDKREEQISFSLDDIRISPRGEKERWTGVIDPENPFGDLTKEEEFRLRELLKGDWNGYLRW